MRTIDNSKHLSRAARSLRLLVWSGVIACAAIALLAALGIASSPQSQVQVVLASSGLSHAWAAGIVLILAAVICAALVELAWMLREVERGALFSAPVTRHFRRFASLLMTAAALRLILPAAASILDAWLHHAASVRLEFAGDDLLALLPAAVLFFVARLFDEAARFEADSRSIV